MKVNVKQLFRLQPNNRLFKAGEQVELTEKEVKTVQTQLGEDFIEVIEKKKVNLEELNKADLEEILNDKEIEFASKATKKDLIKLIEENKEKE